MTQIRVTNPFKYLRVQRSVGDILDVEDSYAKRVIAAGYATAYPAPDDSPVLDPALEQAIRDIVTDQVGEGGGGGGVARFADLEDVDLGTVADSSVVRYDVAEEVWTASPGFDVDAKNFRGDWQDPADTLLWGSDFATQTDVDRFAYVLASGTALGAVAKTTALTANSGESLPEFERCAYLTATTSASSAALSSASWTLDPTAIPALAGKLVSRVSFWRRSRIAPGASANTSTRMRLLAGATPLETLGVGVANTEVVSPWTEKTYPIGDVNVPLVVNVEDTGASNASVPFHVWFAGLRFYGAADVEDLYALGDVVAHEGSYWRSLFDANTHEPTDVGGHWFRIPPTA